jgi:hypothetical protein
MKRVKTCAAFVAEVVTAVLGAFHIPCSEHLAIGSRCGGCRWTGEQLGQS